MTMEFKDSIFGCGAGDHCSIIHPEFVNADNANVDMSTMLKMDAIEQTLKNADVQETGLNAQDFQKAEMANELKELPPTVEPTLEVATDFTNDASPSGMDSDMGRGESPDLDFSGF